MWKGISHIRVSSGCPQANDAWTNFLHYFFCCWIAEEMLRRASLHLCNFLIKESIPTHMPSLERNHHYSLGGIEINICVYKCVFVFFCVCTCMCVCVYVKMFIQSNQPQLQVWSWYGLTNDWVHRSVLIGYHFHSYNLEFALCMLGLLIGFHLSCAQGIVFQMIQISRARRLNFVGGMIMGTPLNPGLA